MADGLRGFSEIEAGGSVGFEGSAAAIVGLRLVGPISDPLLAEAA